MSPKSKRDIHIKLSYSCTLCGSDYESREDLLRVCGTPKLTKDHFKKGDLVRWRHGRVYELKYIDDTGFIGLYKPKDYMTANGYNSREYPGPWAAPAFKFCNKSLVKVPVTELEDKVKQLGIRYRAALKVLESQKGGKNGDSGSNRPGSSVSGRRMETSSRAKSGRRVRKK